MRMLGEPRRTGGFPPECVCPWQLLPERYVLGGWAASPFRPCCWAWCHDEAVEGAPWTSAAVLEPPAFVAGLDDL
ncbi:MAG: hypothetical protein ACLPX9_13920, partial [Rhodomicrobium sp.]